KMVVPDILKSVGTMALRLLGIVIGGKILKSIYSTVGGGSGDNPTFSFYWKMNARQALFGVGVLGLLYFILHGGPVTVDGFGVLAASILLTVFVTGETILMHKEEALDAIESMPGPFALKIIVGLGGFLLGACVSIYYVLYALHAQW